MTVLSDDIFLFSEGDLPGFLRPDVSNLPSALRSIVPSADVAAALADADSLDDASRMRIGTALVTGDGAPRSIKAGARLLLPVDTKWSGKAAVTLAKAHQSAGRVEDACRMALVAMASGERGGAAVADELELRMPLVVIMAVQDEVSGGWPGTAGFETAIYAAVADGDVRAIAGRARAAATGRSVPRSFGSACMLAALTAAARDHGVSGLRDRLERRFGGDAHWRPAPGKASDEAMAFWIDGGTGAAVLAVAASVGSWCPDGMTFAELSFTRENGKTASICEYAGSSDLTHCCGVLGKPPELECRGPIEGTDGYSHYLAGLGEFGFGGPQVDVDVPQGEAAAAAAARDTGGFFLVRSVGCRGGEETAILFRRGGREYAVRIGYSRNVNPDVASELGVHSEWKLIAPVSPSGQVSIIRQPCFPNAPWNGAVSLRVRIPPVKWSGFCIDRVSWVVQGLS